MFDLITQQNYQGLMEHLWKIKDLNKGEQYEILMVKQNGHTLLHAAIAVGSLPILQAITTAFADAKLNLDTLDDSGNSAMHCAVRQGSIAMVEELIGAGAQINDAIPLAQERFKQTKELQYKRIATLLQTRQEWQNFSSNFKFNRVMHLLSNCVIAIESAKEQQKLLFIGSTGAGKSTLLNYLYGMRYKVLEDLSKLYAVPVDGIELASTSHGSISKTLYPLIVNKAGLDFSYCDLAGLFDNRGIEERICAASAIKILAGFPGNVKGLVVVLDLPGFQSLKGHAFRKTAVPLARMLNFNQDLLDNVQFVITKVPVAYQATNQDIIKSFIDGILEALGDDEQNMSMEDKAILFMMRAMKAREEQIYIVNVSDHGQSRTSILSKIKSFVPKPADSYNFTNFDPDQARFHEALMLIMQDNLNRKEKLEQSLPNEINRIKIEQQKNIEKIKGSDNDIVKLQIDLNNARIQRDAAIAQINKLGQTSPQVLTFVSQETESRVVIEKVKGDIESICIKKQALLDIKAKLTCELEVNIETYFIAYKVAYMLGLNSEPKFTKIMQNFEKVNIDVEPLLNLNDSSSTFVPQFRQAMQKHKVGHNVEGIVRRFSEAGKLKVH
jgi:energy-coupling factor transporter ATP-binding protein EcfA2